MKCMDSEEFREIFRYAIKKNFTKDGVEASWADGQPANWKTPQSTIKLQEAPSTISISPDEKYLAVSAKNALYIHYLNDLSLRDSVEFPPYLVGEVQWQPRKDYTDGYLVLTQLSGDWRGSGRFFDPIVMFLELDAAGRRKNPSQNFPVNVDKVARSSAQLISQTLQDEYHWNADDADSERFHKGISELLRTETTKYEISQYAHIKAELVSFGSLAFSNSGTSMITKRSRTGHRRDKGEPFDIMDMSKLPPVPMFELAGHQDSIMWAGFSPNDELIASSCWDETVKIWSATTGELLYSLGPTGSQNWTGAFSPDGKWFAHGVGGEDSGVIVWDVNTGDRVKTIGGTSNWVRTLSWSPDSSQLAFGVDGELRILEFEQSSSASAVNVKTVQSWELDSSYTEFGHSFIELKDVGWIDSGKKVMFSLGWNIPCFEVYDVEKNVRWKFAPDQDPSKHDSDSKFSGLWISSLRKFVTAGPDETIRFWNLD